jgi:hypothetical protein
VMVRLSWACRYYWINQPWSFPILGLLFYIRWLLHYLWLRFL